MGPQTAARALIFMGVMALVLIGLGFAGYALYLAWLPVFAPAGSAVVTAIILLSIPAIWIISVALRTGGNAPANVDDNTLAALASIAKDKPLFAMFLAGLVGAAGAVNGKK
jgi:hypothetical protein